MLPPLNALRAFEAAGRLGSFTEAANELRVSHSAISRHVRGLEARLNTALVRTARNLAAETFEADPDLALPAHHHLSPLITTSPLPNTA